MKRPTRGKRSRKKKERGLGAPPGQLTPPKDAHPSTLHLITFDSEQVHEHDDLTRDLKSTTWINVVGLRNSELVAQVGRNIGIHPLALEDAVHPHQRPKFDDYENGLFVVAQVARELDGSVDIEQLSLFVTESSVVSFQERPGDCFGGLRDRIRNATGRVRTQGAPYLAYAILDSIVDEMFPLLDSFDERLEQLDAVIVDAEPETLSQVHQLQRELMRVRRAVLPLREALNRLTRSDHALVSDDLRLYLRDCHDHLNQQVELLDSQRDLAKSLLDAAISHQGHRSNEVMKVLTMIATIFIPLSFIAGLYGMNFDASHPMNMPELRSPWGYVGVLSLMATIALAMLWFFRRKRWL